MLCKTFKINSVDFTQYAHKNGLSIAYTPIAGLPAKYTLDGTLHDDVIGNKATYTIRMNPTTPEVSQQILAGYRQHSVFLTIFDLAENREKTVLCKTQNATVTDPFVKRGEAIYWQLAPLVFVEK